MIVVLEGVNGVGKSTYAHEFERRGFTQINPFRSGGDTHDKLKRLESLNKQYHLGLNTPVEDLYVWELLSSFHATNIILDRTIPSAIAYSNVMGADHYPYSDKKLSQQLFDFWLEQVRVVGHKVVYVWMKIPYRVAKERCGDRFQLNSRQYDKLENWFKLMFMKSSVLPSSKMTRVQLDSTLFEVSDGVEFIMSKFEK